VEKMSKKISDDELVIHCLNVGQADNIIVQFPADDGGVRKYGIVDCYLGNKTLKYLDKLMPNASDRKRLAFICATHPHEDHIKGIKKVMESNDYRPLEFWESGFRHASQTYKKIILTVIKKKIEMVRVSSGMEWYFGHVKITALSPSVMLRNRYATYGVDMNNASIVLRMENCAEDVLLTKSGEYEKTTEGEEEAKKGVKSTVAILAGDAEFDSWSHICQEYPRLDRKSNSNALVKKMVDYLNADVVKVAHHGSMHSTPLDVYEKITPSLAVISTKQKMDTKKVGKTALGTLKRGLFPHQSAVIALEESNVKTLTTDGSYESQVMANGKMKDPVNNDPGSIVIAVPPGGRVRVLKMKDKIGDNPVPPDEV
jgi:beta-lactamase superfamily II metal-dependent hydrolase